MIDYKLLPGRKYEPIGEVLNKEKTVISIITPFYNGGETIDETANCILNQTYPFFEWVIVDDGSKDKASLKKLDEVAKRDKRIRVFHKENGGPSIARDFGISKASKDSKYVFFIDCDDHMENNMLECLYWTLEIHPDASFAYTATTDFGDNEFIWERYLSSKTEKKENVITISAMVKKEDLLEVGCFGIKEKSMYEDWNLWLKLLAAGKKPVRITAPLFWYRISNTGELSRAKKNHKNAMKYVNETAKLVKDDLPVYQYPFEGDKLITPENFDANTWETFTLPMYKKDDKKTILYIFPWMTVGGADLFNLELIKRLDSNKYRAIVLTTFPKTNELRQEFVETASECYDMSTFMDRKDYIQFVDYIIKSRNVDIVFNSNSTYGYAMLPYIRSKYPKVAILDYIHSVDLKDPRGGFGRCSSDYEEAIDATYACNGFTKNQLETMFKKDKVETIYIGTDTDRFDPAKFDKKELRDKYGISQTDKVITFIARISEEKRPDIFVKAAKLLLNERNDLTFVIAGDGPLQYDIKKLVKKLKIEDKVKMLGMIKDTEEVYAISDVTVNCSRLEGLALTAYESLSMGVPVVSSDVGGQKELITSEVGCIVPYKEKMTKEEIAHEPEVYKEAIAGVLSKLDKLKKNSRKRVLEGFSYDKMVKKFENIFDTIKPSGATIPVRVGLSSYKIVMEYLFDEYNYFVVGYNAEHYSEYNKKFLGMNYYRFKEKAWQHPVWRVFVKSPIWKIGKKVMKK